MNSKKVRGKNFSDQDALDLLSLVASYRNIIENKQTNATTNKDKVQTWKCITEEYNACHPLNTRTVEQLSAKYENLKHRARKYAAQNKQMLQSTGGGPSQTVTDIVLDTVLSILPKKSVEGEMNLFDCDSEPQTIQCCIDVDENNYIMKNNIEKSTFHAMESVLELTASEDKPFTLNLDGLNNMPPELSGTSGTTATSGTSNPNKSKSLRKKRKHDPQDVDKILETKAKLYITKAKVLELECNLKAEEIKNKILQNQLLEEELQEKKETRLVRLAILAEEELEEKKLRNLQLRAETP